MSCEVCGETRNVHRFKRKTPLCWAHYLQMRRHGRILERTKYTPNEFIEHEDHAEIVLYRGERTPIARALIDIEDLPRVREYKWHVANRGRAEYVETFMNRSSLFLHTFILGKREGFDIDHINGNTLDNRRSNLRHLTHHENVLNRHRGLAKSGRMGVWWRPERNRWVGRIILGGKQTSRHFKEKAEAIAWRAEMERKYVHTSEVGH